MGRRLGVEAPAQPVGQEAGERIAEVVGAELGQRGLAEQGGHEPVVDFGGKTRVRQVRPFVAFGSAQEHDALAPLLQGLRPRQPVASPALTIGIGEQSGRRPSSATTAMGCIGKRNGAESTQAPRAQRQGRVIDGGLLTRLDAAPANRASISSRP